MNFSYLFRKSFAVLWSIFLMTVAFKVTAQLPQPDIIYMNFGSIVVGGSLTSPSDSLSNYNPLLPVSATNPSHNTISMPPGSAGLAVSKVLGSSNNTLTFYTTVNLHYWYYDPVTNIWIDTGDSTGTSNTVNIGAGGGYIYSLQPIGNFPSIYRYDGTGDATYLTNVFSGPLPYDVAVDCEGNFYIIRLIGPVWSMHKWNSAGTLVQSYTMSNPNNLLLSGGLAIIGNGLYADASSQQIAHFNISGTNISFVGTSAVVPLTQTGAGLAIGDFATVPFDASGMLPALSVTASDTIICNGDSVAFSANTSGGGSSPLQWKVNGIAVSGAVGNGFTYHPADNDVITCELTGNGGCSGLTVQSPPVVIHVQPAPAASFTLVTSACVNDTVVAMVDTPQNIAYQWNFGGAGVLAGSGPGPYELVWSTPGNHTVSLTAGQGGCMANASRMISVSDIPTLTLVTENSTVCSGDTLLITAATGNGNILTWLNGVNYTLSDPTDNSVNVVPAQACTVFAKATNEAGCSNVRGIEIKIADHCCALMIPNAFSPNGDGTNDLFEPIGRGFKVQSFRIFNRWGEIVFSSFSNDNCKWDGNYKGKPADIGTYYYDIKYWCTENDHVIDKKGDVAVIR